MVFHPAGTICPALPLFSKYFCMKIVDPRDKNGNKILSTADLDALMKNSYERMERRAEYLWESWYTSLDYDYALSYFKKLKPAHSAPKPGLCSAMRKGGFYGRNFDWYFNNNAEFIVHTPSANGRYATVGIASPTDGPLEERVLSREHLELYRVIPFYLVDGINEKGLTVNDNVVPAGDKGVNLVVEPDGEVLDEVCAHMLPRFILDRFATAREAIDHLKEHTRIYQGRDMVVDRGFELHFMLGDECGTWIVEFVEGKIVDTKVGDGEALPAIITNFHLTGAVPNTDLTREMLGVFYTPQNRTQNDYPSKSNRLTLKGSGIERYNLLASLEPGAGTLEGMQEAMKKLAYTNAYDGESETPWLTEMTGAPVAEGSERLATVDDYPDKFQYFRTLSIEAFKKAMEDPEEGRREGKVW